MMTSQDLARDTEHVAESITAVIGDLQHARQAINGGAGEGWAVVAAKLAALAGELAELARALHP